jgi:cell division protein ZapE
MMRRADLQQEYQAALVRHGYRADTAQLHAVDRLADLAVRLRGAEDRAQGGFFSRWRAQARQRDGSTAGERGVYLWGGVGRGKTFLMDLFHAHVGVPTRREHFHRLMKDLHARLGELRDLRDLPDPLQHVAADIARDTRVLCLDELFVSDIADAMLLGGLFAGLFERGVTLVFTSNLPPSQLYRDGLQRQRFLPAIAAIERHCEVINVEGGEDYRLRLLEKAPLYLDARLPDTRRQLETRFADLCGGDTCAPGQLLIEGRDIPFVARADEVVWFDFDAICDGPRSQADFVEIARDFHTVMVSQVPQMDQDLDNPARRFIALVDEFYDRGVKLVLAAHAPIDELYVGDRLRFEFNRTRSRLTEMQTHEYLSRPHRP